MKVIFDNLHEFNLARDCFESRELFMAKVLRLDFAKDFDHPAEFNATGEMTPANPVKPGAAEQIIAELRQVCGEAYQLAGAVGAPVKALDNLLAAADGRLLPHESFLPLNLDDFGPSVEMRLKQQPVHWSEVIHETSYTRTIGDGLSEVIGDTFIDHNDMSPSSQWARIAGILLYYGIDLGYFVNEKKDNPPPMGADW
jgi:hypothetical protein